MNKNVDTTQKNTLRLLSLCSGYGGLDHAIQRIFQSRIVAYSEIEAYAVANLLEKMEEGSIDQAPVWTDLKTFPGKKFHGLVDIICGGYPCQPFSTAGKQKAEKDERHLFPYIKKIIKDTEPGICVFENVRNHVQLGLSTVLAELKELGYRVRAGIFSAEEIGAPHKRDRVFIVATDESRIQKSFNSKWQEILEIGEPGSEHRKREEEIVSDTDSKSKQRLPLGEKKTFTRAGKCGENVANSNSARLQGSRTEGEIQKREITTGYSGQKCTLFPAGQGPFQYEWEPPRVTEKGNLNPDWVEALMGLPVGWTKINSKKEHRENRLRLLGNGVVPQQAEFAIRTLLMEISCQ